MVHDHDEDLVLGRPYPRNDLVVDEVAWMRQVADVARERADHQLGPETAQAAQRLGHLAIEADHGADAERRAVTGQLAHVEGVARA